MKMLFISNVSNKVSSFSLSNIIAAQNLGIEFHLAANYKNATVDQIHADEEKYGVHLHHIDFERNPINPKNIKAFNQLEQLIKTEAFDVIHCTTPIGGLGGRIIGNKCRVKKVIYQVHGFHFYNGAPVLNWILYYPIERLLSHFTDVIITTNKEDYERAIRFKKRNNGNVYYVPGVGLDFSRFYGLGENERAKTRKELGLKESDFMILSCGELNENKNHKVIIQALSLLNKGNIYYFIAGDGPLRIELNQLIDKYSLDNRIKLLGYRTDVPELCNASDIFAFPSIREGFGMASIEAMNAGCPLVASDIRGVTEYAINEYNCILCNPNSVEEFSTAIQKYYNNREMVILHGKNASSTSNKFSREIVVEKMMEIYSKELF